ncbi:MAG: dienelactone hydrolase family protein [Betaproteobacteria bacterium]|nr:dienelactone hydrolase family protein [Betaproteobacteria bacterium]
MEDQAEHLVSIPAGEISLEGALGVPAEAQGLVIFAHGSGSSRLSPRNNHVAHVLRAAGLATLLLDLLTTTEDTRYATRFDIPLLTRRLGAATEWARGYPATKHLLIGYFGASTGAAAALGAASLFGDAVAAVVSRGGRPDLAAEALGAVRAPTLLIVGGRDDEVIRLNQEAFRQLTCAKALRIVPGATHLFEEPGTLDAVAQAAAEWFGRYLKPPQSA